jgi:hypothetical protein
MGTGYQINSSEQSWKGQLNTQIIFANLLGILLLPLGAVFSLLDRFGLQNAPNLMEGGASPS